MKRRSAFTLIEILTVVAIMGIITGLSLGPIRASRIRSRDAKRKADVNLLAQGVDLYLSEKKVLPGENGTECKTYLSSSSADWTELKGLLKDYVPAANVFPTDPLNNPTYRYSYECSATTHTFTLKALLENPNDLEGTLVAPSTIRHYEITR